MNEILIKLLYNKITICLYVPNIVLNKNYILKTNTNLFPQLMIYHIYLNLFYIYEIEYT
jgi:hypothetical protein